MEFGVSMMSSNSGDFDYIGIFIRNYRQANGLSLQALADSSGVSRSMIAQIESLKTNPTLAVLQKLALAIDIELRDLVQPLDEANTISHSKPNDENIVSKADSAFVCHLLHKYQSQTLTEIYHFYFRFPGRTSFAANVKGSKKSIWLESGELSLYLSTRNILIKEKELVSFSANIPHRFESQSTQSLAKGTMFVVY